MFLEIVEGYLPVLGSHHKIWAGGAFHLQPGGRSPAAAAVHPPHVHRLEGTCDGDTD